MSKYYGPYYEGISLTEDTIGWALSDPSYGLLKGSRNSHKDLWGLRQFRPGENAEDRRISRTARRMIERKKARIGLVKSYFDEAIEKADPNFYQRLANSKYHLEDKDEEVRSQNALFDDPDFKDKDYHTAYPTIFHLRYELLMSKAPHDVRLVYLAVLHLFKHRGHFYKPGLSVEETMDIRNAYAELSLAVEELFDINLPCVDMDEMKAVLSSVRYTNKDKAEMLMQQLSLDKKKDKKVYDIIRMICGMSVDVRKLFEIEEAEEKISVSFSSYNYETEIALVEESVDADAFRVIVAAKEIYDIGVLAGILNGYDYISEAKISAYEKHKEDLQILKQLFKDYGTGEEYRQMFSSDAPGSYSAYVNSYVEGKKKIRRRSSKSGRSRDALYAEIIKFIKKSVAQYGETEDMDYVLDEISKQTFLPKQMTDENKMLPYQIGYKELKKILENAEGYLPFLLEKDDSGLTTKDRILRLYSFTIPYYVGPLNPHSENPRPADRKGNGWVERKESGRVLPWNFEEKIDIRKTSEKFIMRQVRTCTYINDDKVLPKSSILYEEYTVLNALSNIRVNGERLPAAIKTEVYALFKTGRKVTVGRIIKLLKGKNLLTEESEATGVKEAVLNTMTSYGRFRKAFGDDIDTREGRKKAEKAIFYATVYGQAKDRLKEEIKKIYPAISNEQMGLISSLNCKDWGRLSYQFLTLIGVNKRKNTQTTIIDELRNTNLNLMELIYSSDYDFAETLEAYRRDAIESLSELTPEMLDELYLTSQQKKIVWQALRIVNELDGYMGRKPQKLFIKKSGLQPPDSSKRKAMLVKLYKKIKDKKEREHWIHLAEELDKQDRLKVKKVFLYMLQLGTDIYTGSKIPLEALKEAEGENSRYNIDHIYPKRLVKDESLYNNLVLTSSEMNREKSDTYPVAANIRDNKFIRRFWNKLHELSLMSDEKFNRLTSSAALTDEQKAAFVNSSYIETSHVAQVIKDILAQTHPDTKVVCIKGSVVSDFRREFELYKTQEVNAFGHAQDAYLTIVTGNVYATKFTDSPLHYLKEKKKIKDKTFRYNLYKMYKWDVERYDTIAWLANTRDGKAATIDTVRRVMNRNTPIITKQVEARTGELYDVMIKSNKTATPEKYVPIKTSDRKLADVTRYGGYSSLKQSYLFVVEHGPKNDRKRTFEGVPSYFSQSIKTVDDLRKYCITRLGLLAPEIIVEKIRFGTLLKLDGYYIRVSGLSAAKRLGGHNAVSLVLDHDWDLYIRAIIRCLNSAKKQNGKTVYSIPDTLTKEKNLELYDELVKRYSSKIFLQHPKPVASRLVAGREVFETLSIPEQCQVLKGIIEIAHYGTCNNGAGVNLSIIGASTIEGLIVTGADISKRKEALIINQSVTGIYDNVIDLKA